MLLVLLVELANQLMSHLIGVGLMCNGTESKCFLVPYCHPQLHWLQQLLGDPLDFGCDHVVMLLEAFMGRASVIVLGLVVTACGFRRIVRHVATIAFPQCSLHLHFVTAYGFRVGFQRRILFQQGSLCLR